jgi:hypothetical protein
MVSSIAAREGTQRSSQAHHHGRSGGRTNLPAPGLGSDRPKRGRRVRGRADLCAQAAEEPLSGRPPDDATPHTPPSSPALGAQQRTGMPANLHDLFVWCCAERVKSGDGGRGQRPAQRTGSVQPLQRVLGKVLHRPAVFEACGTRVRHVQTSRVLLCGGTRSRSGCRGGASRRRGRCVRTCRRSTQADTECGCSETHCTQSDTRMGATHTHVSAMPRSGYGTAGARTPDCSAAGPSDPAGTPKATASDFRRRSPCSPEREASRVTTAGAVAP